MQKVGFSFLVFGLWDCSEIMGFYNGKMDLLVENSMAISNKQTLPRICEYFGKRFSSS
jgi:hypothetical protein